MAENAVAGLKPELLWKRFYEISQVPRPRITSYNVCYTKLLRQNPGRLL